MKKVNNTKNREISDLISFCIFKSRVISPRIFIFFSGYHWFLFPLPGLKDIAGSKNQTMKVADPNAFAREAKLLFDQICEAGK